MVLLGLDVTENRATVLQPQGKGFHPASFQIVAYGRSGELGPKTDLLASRIGEGVHTRRQLSPRFAEEQLRRLQQGCLYDLIAMRRQEVPERALHCSPAFP